jgi:hypothetical protein
MDASLELREGVALLQPLMESRGFSFEAGPTGRGSGGNFAAGSFVKGSRSLNFSVRYSLGLVSYSAGHHTISHEDYLRAIGAKGRYPGFSERVIDGFDHLKSDLEEFFDAFLNGSDSELEVVCIAAENNPRKKGFGALP